MKHVHIVEPYNSAAMVRMTAPLKQFFPELYHVTSSQEVDITADLNIHIPFHTMYGLEDKGEGKHIVAYTHCNKGEEARVQDACNRADMVTAMSFKGRDELLSLGIPAAKIAVNYCAADEFQYRKRIIGIVGYPQPNGRKNENILLDLAWNYDLSPYEFVFTGKGWGEMVEKLHMLGVTCSEHHADTFEKLTTIMRFFDVMLVTGYREGGPLPLLESMSAGVPVLSPYVGYAADILDKENIYSNVDELSEKLNAMFSKSFENHQLARIWNWSDYAAEYARLAGHLLDESIELFPDRAAARYEQLLDIIDEIRPAKICEIGTWNGNRAIQMIQRASHYRPVDEIEYRGFDLFETQTDEQFIRELSKHGYMESVVLKRIQATCAKVELVKGDTKQTLQNDHRLYDFIFVDGGHSEKTIENDGAFALSRLFNKEVAVFDDYYHEGCPEGFGCNKFIDALDRNEYEVAHLPVKTLASDGRLIGMVKVKRHAAVSVQMQTTAYSYA